MRKIFLSLGTNRYSFSIFHNEIIKYLTYHDNNDFLNISTISLFIFNLKDSWYTQGIVEAA